MNLTKLSAVAIAAIGMLAVAAAEHSTSPCNSAYETVDTGAGATIYVVNDDTGTWLYLEQNGHAGLQRGGIAWYEAGLGTGIDSDCWDVDAAGNQIDNPDMILF